jgi:hypothetical protein
MELVQRLRNKQEQVALHRFLERFEIDLFPVNDVISHRALFSDWLL